MGQQVYAACLGNRVQRHWMSGRLPEVTCDVGVDDSEAFEYVLDVGEGEAVPDGSKFEHRI